MNRRIVVATTAEHDSHVKPKRSQKATAAAATAATNDSAQCGDAKRQRIAMMLDREITLADVFTKFISQKQAMNASPETIRCYTTFFQRFITFYGENKPAAKVCSDDIINFIFKSNKFRLEIFARNCKALNSNIDSDGN